MGLLYERTCGHCKSLFSAISTGVCEVTDHRVVKYGDEQYAEQCPYYENRYGYSDTHGEGENKENIMGNIIQLHELMVCLRDTVCVKIISSNGNEILSGEVSNIKSLKGFHHSQVTSVMSGHFGLTIYIDDIANDNGEKVVDNFCTHGE